MVNYYDIVCGTTEVDIVHKGRIKETPVMQEIFLGVVLPAIFFQQMKVVWEVQSLALCFIYPTPPPKLASWCLGFHSISIPLLSIRLLHWKTHNNIQVDS